MHPSTLRRGLSRGVRSIWRSSTRFQKRCNSTIVPHKDELKNSRSYSRNKASLRRKRSARKATTGQCYITPRTTAISKCWNSWYNIWRKTRSAMTFWTCRRWKGRLPSSVPFCPVTLNFRRRRTLYNCYSIPTRSTCLSGREQVRTCSSSLDAITSMTSLSSTAFARIEKPSTECIWWTIGLWTCMVKESLFQSFAILMKSG